MINWWIQGYSNLVKKNPNVKPGVLLKFQRGRFVNLYKQILQDCQRRFVSAFPVPLRIPPTKRWFNQQQGFMVDLWIQLTIIILIIILTILSLLSSVQKAPFFGERSRPTIAGGQFGQLGTRASNDNKSRWRGVGTISRRPCRDGSRWPILSSLRNKTVALAGVRPKQPVISVALLQNQYIESVLFWRLLESYRVCHACIVNQLPQKLQTSWL